jgi:hypothetical protein
MTADGWGFIKISHWQEGCDRAKLGLPPLLPRPDSPFSKENRGYRNGYEHGIKIYHVTKGTAAGASQEPLPG